MVPLDWTSQMRLETYRDMSKFVGQEVGSLGVCNFSYRQLVELLEFCERESLPRPTVLQNECHPLLTAQPVRDLCHQQGIVFQAYASLGAGALGLTENKTVSSVANSHGVTEAQVRMDQGVVRWRYYFILHSAGITQVGHSEQLCSAPQVFQASQDEDKPGPVEFQTV